MRPEPSHPSLNRLHRFRGSSTGDMTSIRQTGLTDCMALSADSRVQTAWLYQPVSVDSRVQTAWLYQPVSVDSRVQTAWLYQPVSVDRWI